MQRISNGLQKLANWNLHEGRFAKCSCTECFGTSPWRCLLVRLRWCFVLFDAMID